MLSKGKIEDNIKSKDNDTVKTERIMIEIPKNTNFLSIVCFFTDKDGFNVNNQILGIKSLNERKQYIDQLETDNYELNNRINELENRFNEFVKVEQTVDSINFALPVEVAKEFDRTMTNIDLNNENKRLKAREQKLIEKLEEDIKSNIPENHKNEKIIIDGQTYHQALKIYAQEILSILKGEKE